MIFVDHLFHNPDVLGHNPVAVQPAHKIGVFSQLLSFPDHYGTIGCRVEVLQEQGEV